MINFKRPYRMSSWILSMVKDKCKGGLCINNICKIMVAIGDPRKCFSLSQDEILEKREDLIEELGNVVLKSKDAGMCYWFLYSHKNILVDISPFQEVIIESDQPHLCYHFACLFPSKIRAKDIERLQDIVIKYDGGDAGELIFRFAKDVVNANIKSLENALIEKGQIWYCYLFARDIAGANVVRLRELYCEYEEEYNTV